MTVDGTLIACDRVAADRPFYSGKHQQHGMNIQVVAAPDGEPLWTSWSLPGAVHDTKAAQVWKIAERIELARSPVLFSFFSSEKQDEKVSQTPP